ncbi:ABC transporter permease [Desulforhopalus singaporensis]|uniref:Putative spermidine/putrescine transport system permease protein n=1 Tax=Desulforhopalus singaporensis TaxID=91360 RepID=A0A1H0SX07_9BACT|nr:ABC transporter permease subunit [Desulforhopalus singaporensis]SDP46145.1 putative spermidine/putrescine transport system permease protein [Desulforhopalus singaporensis]
MKIRHFPFVASIVFAVIIPFLPLILWSFSTRYHYPALLPQEFGIRGWMYVLDTARGQIAAGIYESFTLALVTTLISLVFGLPAGRALGLYDFPGKKLASLLLMLPVIVPPLSVTMGLHLWFIRLELVETFAGVVLIHLTFCLPYTIFVFWGVFSDYDPDFEDQARSLGASPSHVVFKIMLPMVLPGVVVAALFSFLLSWSQYLSTLIIGGGKMLTLPILLFSLMDSGDRPIAGAVCLIFILPAFLALIATTKSLGHQSLKGMH